MHDKMVDFTKFGHKYNRDILIEQLVSYIRKPAV